MDHICSVTIRVLPLCVYIQGKLVEVDSLSSDTSDEISTSSETSDRKSDQCMQDEKFLTKRKREAYERDLRERQEEVREFSSVSWSVYREYFKAIGSYWLLALILFLVTARAFVEMSANWWLSYW